MINLSIDEILCVHEKLLKKTGGLSGIRDIGLLESAVYSTIQSFGGNDIYPTPIERSARLAFSIVKNHPFIDGNKRTGILVMLMTLELNNQKIAFSQQELISLGLSIANSSIDYPNILKWIKEHLV